MQNIDEQDDIKNFERKESAHRLPIGWVLLFVGLVLWGAYYFYAYTPCLSGWTQDSAFEQSMKVK